MSTFYSTDEDIIQRCTFLLDCYRNSSEIRRELDGLYNQIQSPHKGLWESIISGLKHSRYDNFNESLLEYEKIENSIENNTLLHIFFQKEKLYSYVFSDKGNIDTFVSSCNQLMNQYKDGVDPLIKWMVAALMLLESYCLWKLKRINLAEKIEADLINEFKDFPNNLVQIIVVKALSNKAYDFRRKGLKDKELSVYNQIINKYQKNEEVLIQRQVAKTLVNKASFFYQNDEFNIAINLCKEIEETFSKKNNACFYEEFIVFALLMQSEMLEKSSDKRAMILHDRIFNSYKHCKTVKVQRYVMDAISRKMTILEKLGRFNEKIKVGSKAVNLFKNSNSVSIQQEVLAIMFRIAETFNQMGKLQKEIRVYTDIINSFKKSDFLYIKVLVIKAMRYKVSILQRLCFLQEAINICDEAIGFCERLDDDRIRIDLIVKKAYLLRDRGDYDAYTQIYNAVMKKYSSFENVEIRKRIIRIMFVRAQEEGKLGRLEEKIIILKEILAIFEKDTDPKIVEPITSTILSLGDAFERKNDWYEAIRISETARNYLKYDDNDIQSSIAMALSNVIVNYEILGEKEKEIIAYEDFIEIFKMSENEEIKSLVADAEAELTEKKRWFESQQCAGGEK